MTRSLNVTPKTTLCSGKSEASVTIIEDSAGVIILFRLTTDGHSIARPLCNSRATTQHSTTDAERVFATANLSIWMSGVQWKCQFKKIFNSTMIVVPTIRITKAAAISHKPLYNVTMYIIDRDNAMN